MSGTPRSGGRHRARPVDGAGDDLLSGLLLAARLALLVLFAGMVARGHIGGPDVYRFRDIALAPGTPWRDFTVEYAPLQVALLRVLFGASLRAGALRLAVLAFAGDVAAFAALRSAWGRRAGLLFLVLGLPLQSFIYQRIDLAGVALAVIGAALVHRRLERSGGTLIAAAVLFKLWPIAVIPAFGIERRKRALTWSAAIVLTGIAAWVIVGGIHAPGQVSSFRGSTGWQEESSIGSVVWLATGGAHRYEGGAWRVGTIPGWAPAILAAAAIAALTAIWLRASRTGDDPYGAPSLVALSALVLASPVFSAQYVCWLLPWAAIAGAERRRTLLLAVVFVAAFLTGATDSIRNAGLGTTLEFQLLGLARNLAVAAVIPVWWLERSPLADQPSD